MYFVLVVTKERSLL